MIRIIHMWDQKHQVTTTNATTQQSQLLAFIFHVCWPSYLCSFEIEYTYVIVCSWNRQKVVHTSKYTLILICKWYIHQGRNIKIEVQTSLLRFGSEARQHRRTAPSSYPLLDCRKNQSIFCEHFPWWSGTSCHIPSPLLLYWSGHNFNFF